MSEDSSSRDIELVSRAREGDQQAMVDLWSRHYPAVLAASRRLARQPRDAEEIASDAFSGMLAALKSGGGPTGSVRAYLLTSVKNVAVTRSRRASATDVLTDDVTAFDTGGEQPDPVAHRYELGLVREAFAALPPRWRTVLWRTAVDHESNLAVAEDLGLSPNAVAALARRARRGLRSAYVQAHVSSHGVAPGCKPYVGRLADLVTDTSGAPASVRAHVASCSRCTERLEELRAVDRNISGVVGPAVVALLPTGAAWGAAGVASAGTATTGAAATTLGAGTVAGTTTLNVNGGLGLVAMLAGGMATLGLAAAALWAVATGSPPPAGPAAAPPATATTTQLAVPPTPGLAPAATAVRATGTPPTTPRTTVSSGTTAMGWAEVNPPVPPRQASTRPPAPRVHLTTPRPPATAPQRRQSDPQPSGQAIVPIQIAGSLDHHAHADRLVFARVVARSRQVRGPVTLRLTLPAGVTLVRRVGGWRGCAQQGQVVVCSSRPNGRRVWSGALVLDWSAHGTSATALADVRGRTASGATAEGTIVLRWRSSRHGCSQAGHLCSMSGRHHGSDRATRGSSGQAVSARDVE
jgi:RNA polymerase sigma factor (sigma-70 family)